MFRHPAHAAMAIGAAAATLGLAVAAAPPTQAARVVLGEGRGGLAFRVAWFERADPNQPAAITRYVFPVACDYDSQELRGVHPVRAGAEVARDAHGNVTIGYADPLPVAADAPLMLGSVNEIVLYSRAFMKVKPRLVRSVDIPDDVRATFTADDEILTLTDPELSALARRLREEGDGEGDLGVALRIWRYVYENVSYGRVQRPNTAAQVLQWRKGQCGEYGKLTIALLRANGIPARGVWCVRAGNTGPAGNDHAWAEAWIGGIGWFPIRPQEEVPTNDQYPLAYHTYPIVCRPECGLDDLRDVTWENVDCPTGYRGVGFFADVPEGQRAASIELFLAIANDPKERDARRHLQGAAKAHRAVQPMLYWLLAASPFEEVGEAAAERLVALCAQPDRRLDLERFRASSPRLVQARLLAAQR